MLLDKYARIFRLIQLIQLVKHPGNYFSCLLSFQIDRLYEWKRGPNSSIVDTLKKQGRSTKQDFEERLNKIIAEFAEEVNKI